MSYFNLGFGLIDGALNAFPAGGYLYYCGKFSEDQRSHITSMFDYYNDERNFVQAVSEFYTALAYIDPMAIYCYYGLASMLDEGQAFWTGFNLLYNILFNFGFMWTDIIMIYMGFLEGTQVPEYATERETDLTYYFAFYSADFFFRFIFKETNDGYCWLPWNTCADIVAAEVVVDTDITDTETTTDTTDTTV